MRWKVNKDKFNEDDVRYIKRFAWLPVVIDEYNVWLSFYFQKQVFTHTKLDFFANWYSGWETIKKEKHLTDPSAVQKEIVEFQKDLKEFLE